MTDWLCPETESFTILNKVETFETAQEFKLVIDFCEKVSFASK